MLSYRHAYHAGNFADVFKHVVLVLALESLRRKDKPFLYLDTHAGAGRYDLRGEMAVKNREHAGGIGRLWNAPAPPAAVTSYLDVIRMLNPHASAPPRWYPGSPVIARHFLRRGDRMLLAEKHPADGALLRAEFSGDRQVLVFREDGYHLLKSKLPAREHRALILIDPAYELSGETERAYEGVQEGHRRMATGTFTIWYPVMPKVNINGLKKRLHESGIRRIVNTELCIHPRDNPLGMNGSGLIIINPPWQLDKAIDNLLPWLWRTLSPDGRGDFYVRWLVEE
ncbi:MAG TPA: 23S rRNA (adenine(2030)-N(6))-methyltransferase RlmJ [Gammaproteobacteria bacterium]|nr:23S rRNA (adenine(2030)-N(6))-methyltransferase RlmJ [Gammaproteobacteria bacterium]